ncbi:LysR family transcriptional regulator [Lactobacillus sp. XV13L]|nr:LysR family transcriptional regulator [Lactobacillus sp. XV13L]
MNLDHLEIFVDLAETLNFRKTAYRRNISQPAVSQALNSIENEIGVKLFKRSRRGVEILPKGQLLYENIKPLLNTYFKSIQEVQQTYKEKFALTIGITNSPYEEEFIPQLIPRFRHQFPSIKIFLQNYDHTQLKRQLLNGDCDLILTTKDDVAELKDAKYDEIITGNFCATVPRSNSLSAKSFFISQDFKDQSIILLDNNWCPPEQLRLQEIIRKENIAKDIAYVNNVNTANIMSRSGLGITFSPDFICGKDNKYVKSIPIKYDIELSYGVASLTSNKKTSITQFTDFLKDQLQIKQQNKD